MGTRPTIDEYFMQIAIDTGKRSSCCSDAKGALIVVDGHIVSTGYNGAPHGVPNCKYDVGVCHKRKLGYGHGEGHENCLAVHAEANAIVIAAKLGIRTAGGVMYCTYRPCNECAKLIINAGIKKVVFLNEYPSTMSKALFTAAGVECVQFTGNVRM